MPAIVTELVIDEDNPGGFLVAQIRIGFTDGREVVIDLTRGQARELVASIDALITSARQGPTTDDGR